MGSGVGETNKTYSLVADFVRSKGADLNIIYWYVRHHPCGENYNCCTANGGLANCLADVKTWSDKNKYHPVITVFLVKKQAWGNEGEQRSPKDLDELIKSCITEEKLFRPK